MSTDLTEYHPGAAMAALMPQQQNFVEALIAGGSGTGMVTKAAVAAGYEASYGWKLMRIPKVLAAVREEAAKGLLSGALLGQKVLMEIAMQSDHKDRFRAARELLAHSGFTITQEQKITVEHVNSEAREMIREIQEFAKATGLDAKQLLSTIGIAQQEPIEAEFTEVWTA